TPTISAPPANSEKPPVGRIERVASNEDMDLDASPASQATLSFTENSPVTAVPGKQQQADDRGDGGVVENESGIIKLTGVPLAPLHDPTAYIVHSLTFRLEAGENCLILDPTRSRKASLFRLLDTLVPLRSGKMVAPPSTSIYRITSYPNFPTTANLREQLIYPHRAQQALQRGYDDARLYEFLKLFELSHLLRENDVGERGWLMVTDWKKHLTPSERQRIAVIRILYHCPQFVILDDCFRNFGSDNERGKWLEIFFEEATRRRITVLSALNVSMREIEGLPAAEGSDMRALWERLLGWHSKLLEFRSDDDDDDGGGGDGGGNEGGPEYSFTDIVNSGAGRLFTLEDAKRAYREEEELCERAATTAGSGFSTWSEGTSSPSAKQRGRLPPLHAMLAAKFDENQHTSQSQQQPPPLSAAADPMSESFRSLRIISKANRPSTAVLARRLSERLPMKNPTTNPELIISQHSRPPSVARTYSRSASPTASISSVVSSHTAPPTSTAVGTTVNSSQQRLARAANLQQAQQQPQQEREQKQRQSSVGSVASLSQAGSPVLSPSLLAQRGIPSSETGSGHVRRSSTISNDSWHERL
ncbi:ATP-binding cassette sub- D member 3, partial [Spiromyces aspiralis]